MHDPATKFRSDYAPPPYLITDVHLDFILNEDVTHVHSTLAMVPNHAAGAAPALVLNGRKVWGRCGSGCGGKRVRRWWTGLGLPRGMPGGKVMCELFVLRDRAVAQ